MKEKRKDSKEKQAGGGGDSPFTNPTQGPVNNLCHLSCGPYAEELPVAGMSGGEVRKRYAAQMDIDPESQMIVDGKPQDDQFVLKAGQAVMFIKHAGEKGGKTSILIEGETATAKDSSGISKSMPVAKLLQQAGACPISTGTMVLPHGVRAALTQGACTPLVWEKPPHVARLSWIAANSPAPYGPGTQYREVSISLPYLIVVAAFNHQHGKASLNTHANECFFRNEPLRSLNDELLYPALLNCSVMNGASAPLAWICTQYLARKRKHADPYAEGMEAVRACLLETSFNLSSEHHEGNSWFGATKKNVEQVATVERWERETERDPLFATRVKWLPTKHTVAQFAERTFKRLGIARTQPRNSDDLARVILNSTEMEA